MTASAGSLQRYNASSRQSANLPADAVAFLASSDARFVNGEILRVDGATLA